MSETEVQDISPAPPTAEKDANYHEQELNPTRRKSSAFDITNKSNTVAPYIAPKSALANIREVTITWKDVTYKVKSNIDGGKTQITLLDNLSGAVFPGQLVAIMGPSGCGKTTLLDCLADRLGSGTLEGEVLVNGSRRDKYYRRLSSYVPQEDSLIGVLSVRETFMFAAKFVTKGLSELEMRALVSATIEEMGLKVCADARIGDVFFKGISGGQKRRVSMGVELLKSPSVLLLDEPTSGLDSISALGVVHRMVALAQARQTVMCTIHQPSSEIFHLFDKLLLMVKGRMVYFGDASKVVSYFETQGLSCPPQSNPADYCLTQINTDFPNHADVDALVAAFASSSLMNAIQQRIADQKPSATHMKGGKVFVTSTGEQFLTLTKRNLVLARRSIGLYGMRMVMYTGLSLMCGSMYWGMGFQYQDLMLRTTYMAFIQCFYCFMAMSAVPAFIENRALFVRERGNGNYDVLPFVLSNFAVGVVFIGAITFVQAFIIYMMGNLQGNFFIMFLCIWSGLVCGEAVVSLVSACVPNFIAGIAVSSSVFCLFLSTFGFIMIPRNIPIYWKWLHEINFMKRNYRVIMSNEFSAITFTQRDGAAEGASSTITGKWYMETFFDVKDVNVALDLGLVLCFTAFFQFCLYQILRVYHTGKR